MKSAFERYQNDPAFHHLVDVMRAHIMEGMFTPTELREAAILAATIVNSLRPTKLFIGKEAAASLCTAVEQASLAMSVPLTNAEAAAIAFYMRSGELDAEQEGVLLHALDRIKPNAERRGV